MTVHERSQGIPRVISVICHNALIGGFARGAKPVTTDCVLEVCRDFDLTRAGSGDGQGNGRRETVLTVGAPTAPPHAPDARRPGMDAESPRGKRWYSFFE